MQMLKTQAALVAAIFGLAATGSLLVGSARNAGSAPSLTSGAPRAALADDRGQHGDQGDEDQGDRDDNGKHKGWKHQRRSRSIFGTIQNVNGYFLNVRLNDGKFFIVNDREALNRGRAIAVHVGEYVHIYGDYDKNDDFYADRITDANVNSQYGNTGYPGNNNPCALNSYGGSLQTITGYEASPPDASGSFQLVTQQSGVPLPGQTYTIITSNQTCFATRPGSYGTHLRIVGYPSSDGHTLKAVRISS